jgi:broad specificity phosphatase PhoE
MVAHVYLSHPEVDIDPDIPVPDWGLSNLGRERLAKTIPLGWFRRFGRVISSTETKAVQTARAIGVGAGLPVEIRADMHENDRSATGYLPAEEFEQVANAFFASPAESVRGWETAQDAQNRIVRAVAATLGERPDVPTLFVGHGGVGTLLYGYVSRRGISRFFDQLPGGGCHFGFDFRQRIAFYRWQRMEMPPKGLP